MWRKTKAADVNQAPIGPTEPASPAGIRGSHGSFVDELPSLSVTGIRKMFTGKSTGNHFIYHQIYKYSYIYIHI